MANTLPNLIPFLFFLTILFISTFTAATTQSFSRHLSPKKLGLKRLKLTHLHFYFHETGRGKNPSAIVVAEPKTINTTTVFGDVALMDDPLTVGPEPTSKLVGRAQGIYAGASQSELSLLMVFNCVFLEGKYNGSTLSILGRNAVLSKLREMPIVGGTGVFRFASGYAQARAHSANLKTKDLVVEFNVYVFHY